MSLLVRLRAVPRPARRMLAGLIAAPSIAIVLAGAVPVDDGRTPVAVLPVEVTQASGLDPVAATELRGVLERSIRSLSGFKTIELPAALEAGDGCERDPRCVDAHLPRGTIALDLRVEGGEAAERALIFDLRVIGAGRVLLRRSAFVARPELAASVSAAVAELIGHHRPEIDLFERALGGDMEARQLLLLHHPEGAWTRSLLLIEAARSEKR